MSKLERYHIQEPLGEGGMGSVFKAWDTQLQRPVAIKFFHDFDPEDEEMRKRIQQEAINHGTIQHPNIVTLFDHGIDKNRPFAVMELVEGETLHAIVQRQRLSIELFRDIAAQCLEGLNAAHKIGMLHRDLKALNVMLSPRITGDGYKAKILDFGLSKKMRKAEIQTTDHEEGLLGSIHSMAPEQFDRKPLDQRTDLYALGCIFYYALVGKFPFDGETPSDIMVAHLRHFVRPLHLRRPDVPRLLSDWVMKFIEKEPAQRHRSAWAALEELRSMENVTPADESRRDLVKKAIPHLVAIPLITVVALVAITMPLWKPLLSGERSSHNTSGGGGTSAPVAPPHSTPDPGKLTTVTVEQAVASAQAMEADDYTVPFAPSDIGRLAQVPKDQEVSVRGVVGEFLPSNENNPDRELRFRGDDGSFIIIKLGEETAEMFSDDELQSLVGMEVEARGLVEGDPKERTMRLAVNSWSQLENLGDPAVESEM